MALLWALNKLTHAQFVGPCLKHNKHNKFSKNVNCYIINLSIHLFPISFCLCLSNPNIPFPYTWLLLPLCVPLSLQLLCSCLSDLISLSPYIPAPFVPFSTLPTPSICPHHYLFISISDYLLLPFRPYFFVSVSLSPVIISLTVLLLSNLIFIYIFTPKNLTLFFLLISLCFPQASLDSLDQNWSGR